jgi:hypothetical protein
MPDTALIFIPDISGFTRFVTKTEARHASHIISELIGVILESNQLGLAVSEIEGDAVLFYRLGRPPSVLEVIEQARRTFIEFHHFLKIIDRDRVCQCGACTTASGLSLKFVTHYGELDEVQIGDFLKLMGSDVILAHRLLKNDVPGHEYLLLSSAYLDAQGEAVQPSQEWVRLHRHAERIDEFGEVEMRYVPLDNLLDQVPEAPARRPLTVPPGAVSLAAEIAAPVGLVHDYVTDFRKRSEWTEGLRDTIGDDPINRVGGAHTCVFDDLEVHVVTVDHQATPEGYHYVESGDAGFGVTLVTDFRLEEQNGVTHLTVTLIPGSQGDRSRGLSRLWRAIRQRIFLWVARRGITRSLKNLKDQCERTHEETLAQGPAPAASPAATTG